ncbi:MAG: restriction endonuclease [Chloroflexota bacterium]
MPRKYKYSNLQDIAPSSWLILLAIMLGGLIFVVGICLIISFTSWLSNNFDLSSSTTLNFSVFVSLVLVVLTLASIVGISILLLTSYNKNIEKRYRELKIANIDRMTGIEFEQYLKRLLTFKGYSVSMTDITGDLGVDLVATGNGVKISIQAKRYNSKVSRRAVSDAVAGMRHYGCNKAMVITNSYFSPGAVTLATSTGCILIDRDTLAQWVNEFQNSVNLLPNKVE